MVQRMMAWDHEDAMYVGLKMQLVMDYFVHVLKSFD
jgi:hypothetical protein